MKARARGCSQIFSSDEIDMATDSALYMGRQARMRMGLYFDTGSGDVL